MTSAPQPVGRNPFNLAVLVAGLGFFVDAFDLLLFNVLRIPSLAELGYSGSHGMRAGEQLLSIQMLGMLTGGILSGILADRKGRARVLFASILLYSLANLANAAVQNFSSYAILRFLAGLGLAGELGAGIALVGERMHAERRGLGTILVAAMGGFGAVCAGLAGDLLYWRYAYIVAGCAGLALLFLRMRHLESELFLKSPRHVRKGSFFLLFQGASRRKRFIFSLLMGIPIWYSVGMLLSFSPEMAAESGLSIGRMGMLFILFQVGITLGDISSGVLSQYWRSRRKALWVFQALALVITLCWFAQLHEGRALVSFHVLSAVLGFGCGYLSVYVTTVSEIFGTNLRVTATATVTNFMRASIAVLIPLCSALKTYAGWSLWTSMLCIGIGIWLLSLYSIGKVDESFGRDLQFIET
jgi:MFS family permease